MAVRREVVGATEAGRRVSVVGLQSFDSPFWRATVLLLP